MALPKAKELVSSNAVMVFSKSSCPFCHIVKKLLTDLGASFKAIELDQEKNLNGIRCGDRDFPLAYNSDIFFIGASYTSDGSEIQSALGQWTGQRTVPSVFINGKHIGGCDFTTDLHKSGKLVPLLTEAGAVAVASKS